MTVAFFAVVAVFDAVVADVGIKVLTLALLLLSFSMLTPMMLSLLMFVLMFDG